jgi:hypothetical protein
MKKLVITTALAAVLAGGAYAQGHHGGGGGLGGGTGGGGGFAAPSGGGHGGGWGGGGGGGPSMMSRGPSGGPSGPSSFSRNSSLNGPSGQFSRNNQGMQGRTLFNRVDRDDRMRRDIDHDRFSRIGHDRDRDIDFRHRGIVSGDFFVHHRHFRFRRFFHGQFVFLVDFDDCTAWAWVNVAPGVWAWRPINVCIG